MRDAVEIRWIRIGIVGGLCASALYPLLAFPPAEAGSFDIGPLIGLWYLAASIQSWRSLGWARARLLSGA